MKTGEGLPLTWGEDAFSHACATDRSNGVAVDVVILTFNCHSVAQAQQSKLGSTEEDTLCLTKFSYLTH